MKHKAWNHPKMWALAEALGVGKCFALGVVQSLWCWAGEHAPDGAVTCSPRVLARALDFDGDGAAMVMALVSAGWLDEVAAGGPWRVHGWAEHCEDSVHMALARAGRLFADGSRPSTRRLGAEEKRKAEELLAHAERDAHGEAARECAQYARGIVAHDELVRTVCAPADALCLKPITEELSKPIPTVLGCKGGASVGRSAELHSVGELVAGALPPRRGRMPAGWARKRAVEVVAITREPRVYVDWWDRVIGGCTPEQRDVLVEAVRYARDCLDPAARRMKDLGELKKPGAYIAGRLRDAGVKLPPPPAVRAARRAG